MWDAVVFDEQHALPHHSENQQLADLTISLGKLYGGANEWQTNFQKSIDRVRGAKQKSPWWAFSTLAPDAPAAPIASVAPVTPAALVAHSPRERCRAISRVVVGTLVGASVPVVGYTMWPPGAAPPTRSRDLSGSAHASASPPHTPVAEFWAELLLNGAGLF
jgi:hypothetical protein